MAGYSHLSNIGVDGNKQAMGAKVLKLINEEVLLNMPGVLVHKNVIRIQQDSEKNLRNK